MQLPPADKPPPYSPLPSQDAPPAYTPGSSLTDDGSADSNRDLTANGDLLPYPLATQAEVYIQVGSLNMNTSRSRSNRETIFQIHSSDNLVLTIIMLVLCGLMLNIVAIFILIPALLYSKMAANANRQYNYLEARKYAQRSLWLNIAAVVSFILIMLLAVILGSILAFTTNVK